MCILFAECCDDVLIELPYITAPIQGRFATPAHTPAANALFGVNAVIDT